MCTELEGFAGKHVHTGARSQTRGTRALAASGAIAPDRALQKPLHAAVRFHAAVRLDLAEPQQRHNGMGRAVPHPGVLNTGASEKATGKRRREEK